MLLSQLEPLCVTVLQINPTCIFSPLDMQEKKASFYERPPAVYAGKFTKV